MDAKLSGKLGPRQEPRHNIRVRQRRKQTRTGILRRIWISYKSFLVILIPLSLGLDRVLARSSFLYSLKFHCSLSDFVNPGPGSGC